ncbi:MAG: serine O-acetyltransferase [Sulfuritalea sp.]|nr:serine O-acetyltransferase [Sulfuritalea sp.]
MSRELLAAPALPMADTEAAPSLLALAREDMACVFERDPAARSRREVLLTYPGLHAMLMHRLAHLLWHGGWRFSARWLGWLARLLTNVDIHPGATIGRRFFIDHGDGARVGANSVVIGEVPAGRTAIGIPAWLVGEVAAASPLKVGAGGTAINRDHPLIPDPVGKAIQCLLDRIDTLETQVRTLRGEPAPIKVAGCIACAAGELCCEEHGRG